MTVKVQFCDRSDTVGIRLPLDKRQCRHIVVNANEFQELMVTQNSNTTAYVFIPAWPRTLEYRIQYAIAVVAANREIASQRKARAFLHSFFRPHHSRSGPGGPGPFGFYYVRQTE